MLDSRYLRTLVLSCVTVVLLSGCAFVKMPLIPSAQPLREEVVDGEGKKKILVLDISGIISDKKRTSGWGLRERMSMVAEVKEALKKAEADDAIFGVVLRINSPGGTVTSSDILHHEMVRYKEKTGVRVVACLMDVGTSGAYYIATAADEIIAHPTTVTGSIGVMAMKFNVQGLLSRIGIEEETIKSGDMKDLWSPFRPSTPEEKEILQSIIDTLHERFVDVVADGRKSLTRGGVEKLADGRVYTADQARAVGLIDAVGYLDQAVDGLKASAGIEKASVIIYYRPGTYKGSVYSGFPSAGSQVVNLIAVNGEGLVGPAGVNFMYLWAP
ncbi:MAG: signal peptide peptidase SppA [Deltaproteobacteria bacterium]|nr:signal peptide peptidase SppA [Deltaproteobacteria bacterium]